MPAMVPAPGPLVHPAPSRRMPRGLLVGLIAGALALVCCAGGLGAALVINRLGGPDRADNAPAAVRTAVESLAAAPAVHLALTFAAPTGDLVHADLTVTAEGEASGVITDPGGGRAELRGNGRTIAVRGDAAWWMRRDTRQFSGLVDQWIEPRDGVALPVDVVHSLTPDGLANVLATATAGGATNADPDLGGAFEGADVDVVTSGQWTVLVTKGAPRRVVWLGGPISADGPLRPAAYHDGAPHTNVLPVLPDGGPEPAYVPAYDPIYVPPYVSIAPSTPDEAAIGATRRAVAEVLPPAQPAATAPGAGTAAPGTAGPAVPPSAAPSAPSSQSAQQPKVPRFDVTLNTSLCTTPTCSWTVTVTNTGNAPGDATVMATAAPGMPTRAIPLGVIAPGASATTPPMAFGNPAPTPRPGQTTSVRVNYTAQVYCAAIDGPDPGLRQRVQTLGVDPSRSRVLSGLDPSLQALVMSAADLMASGRTSLTPDEQAQVIGALERAVNHRLLPELEVLVRSGRLQNPADLIRKLQDTTVDYNPNSGPTDPSPRLDQIGYRREVEFGANLLRTDPNAKIYLDGGIPDPRGGPDRLGSDVLDTTNRLAYQIKSVNSAKLLPRLREAVEQLNGQRGTNSQSGVREEAPPGFGKVAVLYLEPVSPEHDKTRQGLVGFFRRPGRAADVARIMCPNGAPAFDELVIINATGVHRWTKGQFREFTDACP